MISSARILAASLLLVSATGVLADVKPNILFSDGAVLQRDREIPVWGTADNNEAVSVEFAGQKVSTIAIDGKWLLRLQPLPANAQPAVLTITGKNTVKVGNVLVGEVWICGGQSNMERQLGPRWGQKPIDNWVNDAAEANYPAIRQFCVTHVAAEEPLSEVQGAWVTCSPQTAADFTAVGFYFARDLHRRIKVPVALVLSAWGGTRAESWTSRPALEANPGLQFMAAELDQARREYPAKLALYQQNEAALLQKWTAEAAQAKREDRPAQPRPVPPQEPGKTPQVPITLYNGMIAPLQPYAIRGVIWYQGESNSGDGKRYRNLFPTLIADWRKGWGQGDFPFIFVQLAPYGHPTQPSNDPEIREAQWLTLKQSANTAMVVTTDVGDATDVHPTRKRPVGERLALAARALAYREKVEASGPLLDSVKIEKNLVNLKFTHVGGGLVARDGGLRGFMLAGADGRFYPGVAEIRGSDVVVSSDQVPRPVTVRYGWAQVPDVNLFNQEGLPASPFRSDGQE